MKDFAFLYYTLSYYIGLPALAVIPLAYVRSRNVVLRSYLPFLVSVTFQLVVVAVLRYQDVTPLLPNSAAVVTTKHLYFFAEGSLILTRPYFCHSLVGISHSRARDLVFAGLFLLSALTMASPFFMRYVPETRELSALPGFLVYRGLLFSTILYCIALMAVRFRALSSNSLRAIAVFCLFSIAFSLLEMLHCELFPILRHLPFGIALSPAGYFITNTIFLIHVIREYLLPRAPLFDQGEISEILGRSGVTDREKEILGMLVEGFRNKEICEKLFISESTVKTHIKSIYKKLSVGNRVQLVNFLTRGG